MGGGLSGSGGGLPLLAAEAAPPPPPRDFEGLARREEPLSGTGILLGEGDFSFAVGVEERRFFNMVARFLSSLS